VSCIIIRGENIIKIDSLKLGMAKLYFSTSLQFIAVMYAFFGIGFTILWGDLYTYGIENSEYIYIESLVKQGAVLFVFIIICSITIFVTILWPLLKKIEADE
jgi:hypothetical protein